MGSPLKNQIDAAAVERLAVQLQHHTPDFPAHEFQRAATHGLEPLALKARVQHVARALRDALPREWPDALGVLLVGMGPALQGTDAVAEKMYLWPVLQAVEDHGLSHPQHSIRALPALTQRFSAEFAIRPYIEQHPDVAWPLLMAWTEHPNVHVRRLASEGCRPQLPWGRHLHGTISRGLAVIENLKDDPERYVQRSVANHLNDVARIRRDTAMAVARRWAQRPTPARQWILRHGLRSCIKAGDVEALALIGFAAPDVVVKSFVVSPHRVRKGEAVTLSAEIISRRRQSLMVDVAVDFCRSTGKRRKVFKGGVRRLEKGASWTWSHRLSFRPISTRQYWAGRQDVTLQINGHAMGCVHVDLRD